MFEKLEARAARAAETHADARKSALAEQLRAILPPDIGIETSEAGVTLSGRGLDQRFVLDASLRWTVAGLLK
jgi:hypothetical protein